MLFAFSHNGHYHPLYRFNCLRVLIIPGACPPYALCFAAGAMIFVVVEELIPESQRNEAHIDLVTMATMAGFAVMMILDVALG